MRARSTSCQGRAEQWGDDGGRQRLHAGVLRGFPARHLGRWARSTPDLDVDPRPTALGVLHAIFRNDELWSGICAFRATAIGAVSSEPSVRPDREQTAYPQ